MARIKAIIGANYGDEGKGLATAFLASMCGGRTAIVLTNGGAQRGHTVEDGRRRHVFHHHASVLPDAMADVFFPSCFIVNPMEFARERGELEKDGWPPQRCFASGEALVTTPYDMIVNRILELERGEGRHGSTGMGVWQTAQRSESVRLAFHDLAGGNVGRIVDEIIRFSAARLKGHRVPGDYMGLLESRGLMEHFLMDCEAMAREVKEFADESVLSGYDDVLFENAQGLLLSSDPADVHTTPSFTGMENVNLMAGRMDGICDAEICYVTRTYLTRHGAGPMPGECAREDLMASGEDATNVPNPWQGSLRYGFLDVGELNRRMAGDFAKCKVPNARKSVMLTHMDEHAVDASEIDGLAYLSCSRFPADVRNV